MISNPAYLKSGVFSFFLHAFIFIYAYLNFSDFGTSQTLIHAPINVSLVQEKTQATPKTTSAPKPIVNNKVLESRVSEFNLSVPVLTPMEMIYSDVEQVKEDVSQDSSKELTTQYFVNKIIDTVEAAWRKPINIQDGLSAQFLLKVNKTGKIITYQLHKSSGNIRFDNSGLSAIKRVDKFTFFESLTNEMYESEFKVFILNFNP